MEEEITLIQSSLSPWSQRVRIAFELKGIKYTIQEEVMKNKSADLLKRNPIWKKVPVVVYEERCILESANIVEWIDEQWSGGIGDPARPNFLPSSPIERSVARFWVDFVNKTGDDYITVALDKGQKKEEASVRFLNALRTIEEGMADLSTDGPFFLGDTMGIVDICLIPFGVGLPFMERAGLTIPGPDVLPRFHKWLEVMKTLPAVQIGGLNDTNALLKKFADREAAKVVADAQKIDVAPHE